MWDTGGCGTSRRSGHGHRGLDPVSLPGPPSLAARKVPPWFTQCKSDLSYEWLLLLLAKAAVDNAVGKSWLGRKQPELWRGNLNLEYIKVTAPGQPAAPQGRHSEQEQRPSTGTEPSTCLPAITDIISKQGSFSELLFLIFSSLNANPFDKTVPYAFSVLLPLNLFLPVEKKRKKRGWKKKKKENTSQPSLAAPGFALIPPLSFMLPTGISIWL